MHKRVQGGIFGHMAGSSHAQRKTASRLDETQTHAGAPSRNRPLRDSDMLMGDEERIGTLDRDATDMWAGICSPWAIQRQASRATARMDILGRAPAFTPSHAQYRKKPGRRFCFSALPLPFASPHISVRKQEYSQSIHAHDVSTAS